MELIVLVEERLETTLSMDEILEMTTVAGIARVLANRREKAA
jgi:acyl carrier protein